MSSKLHRRIRLYLEGRLFWHVTLLCVVGGLTAFAIELAISGNLMHAVRSFAIYLLSPWLFMIVSIFCFRIYRELFGITNSETLSN